jgi:transposase
LEECPDRPSAPDLTSNASARRRTYATNWSLSRPSGSPATRPAPRALNAAGIDVGAGSHHVAIPPGRDPEGRDARELGAFTADLSALAEWLRRCGIETVAMESTGV